jgi:hypothetical protein
VDLTAWLRRLAAPRPLLVAAPGAATLRWGVERRLCERGWTLALSAAEADLLIVCGVVRGELRAAVERVWESLPSPRARIDLQDPGDLGAELDRARTQLANPAWQRADAVGRPGTGHDRTAGHHDGHDTSGGHDMHMMRGGEVTGLPMADRAPTATA